MTKENDSIPQELVEDESIFEVLQELVRDADVLALCPSCRIPMAIEEYEHSHCSRCGDIKFDEIVYIYREDDESQLN